MTRKSLIGIHGVLAGPGKNETASGLSQEIYDVSSFAAMDIYHDVTVVAGTTPTLDLIIKAIDDVSTKAFNITDDFEWRDLNGALIPLTATAEGNAVRFIATGSARGKLKSSIANNLASARIVLRWLIGGSAGPNFTWTTSAVLFSDEGF